MAFFQRHKYLLLSVACIMISAWWYAFGRHLLPSFADWARFLLINPPLLAGAIGTFFSYKGIDIKDGYFAGIFLACLNAVFLLNAIYLDPL